jgi:hypothetical protein
MRTVSVNVMWDVQEKNYFSAWEHLWDAKDRTRGFLWGGDPLCRQVREGTGAEAPRRPLRRFPGTREPGKQAPPVLKYRFPHGSHSRSTCPPLSSPPLREQLCNRSCSNKTHTYSLPVCVECLFLRSPIHGG